MDSRQQVIITLIKNLLVQGKPYSDIVELANAKDLISNKPPYLSEKDIHGPLADSPIKVATKMMLEIIEEMEPEDEEYSLYRGFFEEHLAKAKKDIISKQLLEFDGAQWQSVLVHLDAMKSYAKAKGLKPHSVQMHLDRYIMKQKPVMLIDIPKWDKVDRIAQLKSFVKIKNQPFEVFEDALKEWGANIFRRLYHDIYQNRCIILKGGQGIGKDHLLKSLLKGFGPYYSKFSSNRNENDCWAQVTSKLVLHIEEFDQTGMLSIAFLKDMITRDYATYRSPYDRASLTRKCVGSFISTVNIDSMLRDETGNRRFAVFEIESIDWKYPKDWSDQVLSQFYELYRTGFWAKEETWRSVTDGNSNFEQVDIVPELLNFWDMRVSAISKDKGLKELTYGQIDGVIAELCRQSGWKAKTTLSMLKANSRSRKTQLCTVYWSNLIKCPDTNTTSTTRPEVVNYANLGEED